MTDRIDKGTALKIISKRLTQFNDSLETIEISKCCQNCKYAHGVEGYDQQWGMYYCFQSWCDKDKSLMDTEKGNNKHYLTECPQFVQGKGQYDRMKRVY